MDSIEAKEQKNENTGSETNTWYILSLLSWFLFICMIWIVYIGNRFIWIIDGPIISFLELDCYYPMKMDTQYLNMFIFLISALSFVVFMFFTIWHRNEGFYNGMTSGWGKFHFIPLLIISCLIILSRNTYSFNQEETIKLNRTVLAFNMAFTLLGLLSLIFIYIKMELNCEWYITLTIKKGLFTTFIVLLFYNFFYLIICFKSIELILKVEKGEDYDSESYRKFSRGTGIAFSIIIGIFNLVFSFLFKDVIAAFVNLLIYIGFINYFFSKTGDDKEIRKEYFNGIADGVIDIVMMVLTLVFIVFLVLKYKQFLF